MKAELVPENGDPPIRIVRDVTVVGRREFCDIQVNDPSLSKRHCILVKTDGLLVIRDLGTTNGTKVKGQRIRWAALLPDDRITLGAYKVRVYLGPDDMPGPSELARPAKPVRKAGPVVPATGAKTLAAPSPARQTPPSGFPEPSPIVVPVASPALNDLEIVEDDSVDSGWHRLIGSSPREDEDIIIDLE